MVRQQKEIHVYMDWYELEEPIFMGTLHSEIIRGKEIFSYENDPGWLQHAQFRALDPDLSQFVGKQYLPNDKSNFGLFLDSAPDRWGRTLMQRREAIEARVENRSERLLMEVDFLMGIYDGNRMGALRFKFSPEGEFMDNNTALGINTGTGIRQPSTGNGKAFPRRAYPVAEYAHCSWFIFRWCQTKSKYSG